MANGYVCAQCGWQETNHLHGWWMCEEGQQQDVTRVLTGFTLSLSACLEYVPSIEEQAAEAALRTEEEERAGQFNSGWMA